MTKVWPRPCRVPRTGDEYPRATLGQAGRYAPRSTLMRTPGAQASIAFSRSQQRKRSLYAAALAAQLANACGGLCTPALRNPVEQPLTDRQREIIELAATGLSNKEMRGAPCDVGSHRRGACVSRLPTPRR